MAVKCHLALTEDYRTTGITVQEQSVHRSEKLSCIDRVRQGLYQPRSLKTSSGHRSGAQDTI